MSAPTTPRGPAVPRVRRRGLVALGALVLLYATGAVARTTTPPEVPTAPVSVAVCAATPCP